MNTQNDENRGAETAQNRASELPVNLPDILLCQDKSAASGENSLISRPESVANVKTTSIPMTTPISCAESDAEACKRCGGANPSWSAPSPLWNAVMRGGAINGEPLFGDMVCIPCFVALASGIASGWRLTATDVSVPLETVTPSGRVWNSETWLWEPEQLDQGAIT